MQFVPNAIERRPQCPLANSLSELANGLVAQRPHAFSPTTFVLKVPSYRVSAAAVVCLGAWVVLHVWERVCVCVCWGGGGGGLRSGGMGVGTCGLARGRAWARVGARVCAGACGCACRCACVFGGARSCMRIRECAYVCTRTCVHVCVCSYLCARVCVHVLCRAYSVQLPFIVASWPCQ